MSVLKITGGQKYIGSRLLFDKVDISIEDRERWGVIGRNGCGKTTLLNIVAGRDELSGGRIASSPQVNYIEQFIESRSGATVREYLLGEYNELSEELRNAEERLASAGDGTMEGELENYRLIREKYDRLDGDLLPGRADKMIDSLGLPGGDRSAETLSGGEKSLLSLASNLMRPADLLVLDEPDNHLDFRGLAWLESFLTGYRGAVLIVSHNRFMLDRVCDHIVDFEKRTAVCHTGNYSAFRLNKLRKMTADQAVYSVEQKKNRSA